MFLCHLQQNFEFTHFANEEVRPADCKGRLHKVRPFLNSLAGKLHHIYVAEKEMSVDEGMTAWKYCFILKVYMSAKPHRYHIKDYLICESQSGYICGSLYWDVTISKKSEFLELLCAQRLNKGYHVWQDSYYKCVELSEMLLEIAHMSVVHCIWTEEDVGYEEENKIPEKKDSPLTVVKVKFW